MKIREIRATSVPIASSIRNAYIDFRHMDVALVAIITDVVRDGHVVVGYGFNSNGRYAPTALLQDRFIPRLMAAAPEALLSEVEANFDAEKMWRAMMTGEKPGGHGERSVAVGTLDMAIWDAIAKIEERPLWQVLADRYRDGQADDRVFVYAAGGYYQPDKSLTDLQNEMRGYTDQGYSVVKMKIGGASLDDDLRRIEAVLSVVGDGSRLAVDANGRFDWTTASAYATALAPYKLRWFEEAGDPLDYDLQARLRAEYEGPMATGENLFSLQDARNLIRYGGLRPSVDILQFDPVLSYGLVEYLRILEMLHVHRWSSRACIPHGGHQMALNMAAGLGLGGNESYPGLFQPFGGFADTQEVERGFVSMHQTPGVGFEEKAALFSVMRELSA